MKKFFELIIQMQKKGYYLEILKSDCEDFILCFKNDNGFTDYMISMYTICGIANGLKEIVTMIESIQSEMRIITMTMKGKN